jgi:hypothetical protein
MTMSTTMATATTIIPMAPATAMASMTADRFPGALRRPGLRWWPALWLTLCLLLAQQAGLVHRIHHGGLQEASLAALHAGFPTTGTHAHRTDSLKPAAHSCVLFDAAATADTLCDGPPMPRLAHGKPVLPPSITWRWPHLPAAQPFHSRAPPASPAFA